MKETIQKQINQFSEKYGWVISTAVRNMRLLLLCLFAGLAGYLVLRVNTLVDGDQTVSSDITTIKSPDKGVISTFNELYTQNVDLNSNFDNTRQNPF